MKGVPPNDCIVRYGKHPESYVEQVFDERFLFCRRCKTQFLKAPVPPAAPQVYPQAAPVAVARRGDPQTSWEAARAVVGLRESQLRVYELLLSPKTHDELLDAAEKAEVKMSQSGLRSRCSELVDLGLVRDSGVKRETKLGNRSVVWERMPRA